jgi:hypothetical protein
MGENEEHYICAEPTFSHIIRELNVNVSGAQTRRRIIQAIENRINSKVISYTAAFENPLSGISSKDIMPYEDMLTSIGNVELGSLTASRAKLLPQYKVVKNTDNLRKVMNYLQRFICVAPRGQELPAFEGIFIFLILGIKRGQNHRFVYAVL